MNDTYVVVTGDTHVARFEEKANAYRAKEHIERNTQTARVSVNKQVLFESFEEWRALEK